LELGTVAGSAIPDPGSSYHTLIKLFIDDSTVVNFWFGFLMQLGSLPTKCSIPKEVNLDPDSARLLRPLRILLNTYYLTCSHLSTQKS